MSWLVALVTYCLGSSSSSQTPPAVDVPSRLAAEAKQVEPLVASSWVKSWLSTGAQLPLIEPFAVSVGGKTVQIDEQLYYMGRFGSPLSYARSLDIAASAGLDGLHGKRVLDFGYGSIGQIQMMALAGADVTGIDVSPLSEAMYAGRSGPLGGGQVRLLSGRFPAEHELVVAVGNKYDLIISKNTLKRGYIHPSREADPRTLVDLGVDDGHFLQAMFTAMRPGGLLLIYNLCPAKAADDQPYVPWAEGESPFTREQLQKAGFEVVSFDVEDHEAARRLGHALGWDQGEGAMQLESDLFAWYTIVRRPVASAP
jgi:hypothetical protein